MRHLGRPTFEIKERYADGREEVVLSGIRSRKRAEAYQSLFREKGRDVWLVERYRAPKGMP